MPEDIDNVLAEAVPEEGTPSEVVASEEKPPEEQPLTREEVLRLVAEGTERAKEAGRREMQRLKDREVGQALNRAKFAEDTLANMQAGFSELDPQAAETARLRGVERYYQGEDQRQQIEQQIEVAKQAFYGSMTKSLEEMGVDVKDERIDWGTDAPDPATAQHRILSSVGKIQRESAKTKDIENEQWKKDTLVALRREMGLDSPDTTTPTGVGTDAEFVKKFGAGDLLLTQANLDKYNKIKNSYQ